MKGKCKQVARCMYKGKINKSKTILFWIIKDSDENKCMAVTITEGLAFQDPAMAKLESCLLCLEYRQLMMGCVSLNVWLQSWPWSIG